MEQYLPLSHKTFLKQVKISALKSEEIIRVNIFDKLSPFNSSSKTELYLKYQIYALIDSNQLIFLGKLISIKKLSINNIKIDYNNKLTVLPNSIGNLVNLEKLNLGNNKLTVLPDSIGNLVNLKKLDLESNKLTVLPDSIGNLVNLEEINLGSNKLTVLPDSIGNLVKLKKLDLSRNELSDLPKSIGNLVNLRKLILLRNNFSYSKIQEIKSLLPYAEFFF